MANEKLHKAKNEKNDEFYTQYNDIQNEVNAYLDYNPNVFRDKVILLPADDPEWSNFTKFFAQNFERYGLKKLISTSYAYESKKLTTPYQLSLFESESPKYDEKKTKSHGKIFILDRDKNKSGKINIDDLDWDYLKGDGDFRSDEVKKLRDEADIIVTNPPFSLFREFLEWILDGNKKFLIIGNQNVITYRDVFPLLKDNKIWIGNCFNRTMTFRMDASYSVGSNGYIDEQGNKFGKVPGICWFTNMEHGRRHQPLQLMTMQDNIKYSKHKELRDGYKKYENYDAIEVPHVDAIPSDYKYKMGVPITFMGQYNPEQFRIIGMAHGDAGVELGLKPYDRALKKLNPGLRDGDLYILIDGKPILPYRRILIEWVKDAPGFVESEE